MLRSFRFVNHKSFADEQELLLIPAAGSDPRAAVPVTAVYGANASGKSNLLDALTYMKWAVHGFGFDRRADGGIIRRPFRLDPSRASNPSIYVVEFVQDGNRYTYGFRTDDRAVLEEWLYSYPEARKRVIFERNEQTFSIGTSLATRIRTQLEILFELTPPNSLFLTPIIRANLSPPMEDVLLPIVWWFEEVLNTAGEPPALRAHSIEHLLATDSPSRERVLELIRAADVGITDVRVVVDPDGHEEPHLVFQHGNSKTEFRAHDESAGTLSWLNLLPTALTVLDQGHILTVDEIDTSLHPVLTAELVELFQNPQTNPHGAQLIFTSHDPSLLGTSLRPGGLLERDQIWFVEKDADGASTLYPLTDFRARKEHNLERRYLGGAYGAVPRVDSVRITNAIRSA